MGDLFKQIEQVLLKGSVGDGKLEVAWHSDSPWGEVMKCSLSFDLSALREQAQEISTLLKVFEDVPPDLRTELEVMLHDVVLGDCRTALSTEGTHELIQSLRLGNTFECLRATLLARKRDFVGH
jgi:hypothetical protein